MSKILHIGTKNEFGNCSVEIQFVESKVRYTYITSEFIARKFEEKYVKQNLQMVAFNYLKKNSTLIESS